MVRIGDNAPDLEVAGWVQGDSTNLTALRGKVVLVEVFQVNCPGCFLYGLPEAIEVHAKYQNGHFEVLGLATAFEDFDRNNRDNLAKLLETGEVVGETRRMLSESGWLNDNRLRYRIPFAVAVDKLKDRDSMHVDDKVKSVIEHEVPNFHRLSYGEQMRIQRRIRDYLLQREFTPATFDRYAMKGTPTSLLIDKNGILRHHLFGTTGRLDRLVRELIDE